MQNLITRILKKFKHGSCKIEGFFKTLHLDFVFYNYYIFVLLAPLPPKLVIIRNVSENLVVIDWINFPTQQNHFELLHINIRNYTFEKPVATAVSLIYRSAYNKL